MWCCAASVTCAPILRCVGVLRRLLTRKKISRTLRTAITPPRVAKLVDARTGKAHLVGDHAMATGTPIWPLHSGV